MTRPRSGYKIARDKTTAALRLAVASDGKEEYRLHCAIVDLLNAARCPGVVFWHCPNGGKRAMAEAAQFGAMGVLAGVADLQLSIPGGKTCFMEIKARAGVLSEAQEGFLAAMDRNGHRTAVVRSLDEAMVTLRDWGAIRAIARAA